MMRRCRILAQIGLAIALAGCGSLRTPYQPPQVETPPRWGQAEPAGPLADTWWRSLGDPALDRLVDRVLARNNDLAAAGIALRRARLQARYAVVNPTVSGAGSASYNGSLNGGYPPTQIETATLSASYEIDLFGKLAAERDAARWEALATAEDLESTRLALIGTAVDLFYRIAYLNERIASAGESVDYARKTLGLVRGQAGAGAVSTLEIAESAQSLSRQKAGLDDLVEQRVEARAALGLLLDGEAAAPDAEPPWLPRGALPPVDAGLPASLLGRRPDLRAAEMRVRRDLARLDRARLSFYPSLSLTGALGLASSSLSSLLLSPPVAVGANLVMPFLQWDQLKLGVGVSRADYDAAVVLFRQTLRRALADVGNALSARDQLAAEARELDLSLANARTVERLNEIRYRTGGIPLKTWLDAQESRRQAEAAWAQNRLDRYLNYVALCEALGGDAVAPSAPATLSPRA